MAAEPKSLTYTEAVKEAKVTGKIIMIKAISSHCHYCLEMDKEVFANPKVQAVLDKGFLSVSIDVGKEALPLGLKSQMTPTFFFVTFQPKQSKPKIKRIPGAWHNKEFLEILTEIQTTQRSHR